jgi:protocatechuate 3,4-dioxygenase beta subunit
LAKYLKNILITVKDSQGTPLENVTVVITNGDGQNRFIGVTDEKGEVLFESAMPGEYFSSIRVAESGTKMCQCLYPLMEILH